MNNKIIHIYQKYFNQIFEEIYEIKNNNFILNFPMNNFLITNDELCKILNNIK